MEIPEYEIDTTIEFNGKTYRVVEYNAASQCHFCSLKKEDCWTAKFVTVFGKCVARKDKRYPSFQLINSES